MRRLTSTGATKPPLTGFGADYWSARWTGYVQAQYSHVYTFHVRVSDGVRLWVNGQLLINRWKEQKNAQSSSSIALLAGQKYDIQVEYYDAKGSALLELSWSSASTRKQVIPPAQFSTVQPPQQTALSSTGISMVSTTQPQDLRSQVSVRFFSPQFEV
jgi:hypothetical protein